MYPVDKRIRKFRGYKKIRLGGMTFIIQKINPLIDIQSKELPMIFTHIDPSNVRMRKLIEKVNLKDQIKYMAPVIKAGVVEPPIMENPNDGFTVEDFFVDPLIGYRLWEIILNHSLNRFKGIKGVFFSIMTKLYLFIRGRKHMADVLTNLLSQREDLQNLNP